MADLQFKVDLKPYRKGMSYIQKNQVPFAASLALTEAAGHVGLSWQDEMRKRVDRPTPFTVGAVTVIPARKTRLVATVLVKEKAAEYLQPFVDGGKHFLGGKRALLAPKNVPLNAYGNLPRNKIKALKAAGAFSGAIKLRSGETVSGIWQRVKAGPGAAGRHLKLLVRFAEPQEVKQRLRFYDRANDVAFKAFAAAFPKAFARAMATLR
ncbi:MAG: hypothetical protein JSR98_20125 [Proteobacteria bacterium]|nr:hypothetical protein [Pseudomonadota bacterium]